MAQYTRSNKIVLSCMPIITFYMQKLYPILFLLSIILFSPRLHGQSKQGPITVGETTILPSKILQEDRRVNIYLPTSYTENAEKKYPVVYILDGGVEEDFLHLTGLLRFSAQAWVDRFPEAIVVGIENVNRRRDFTFAVPNLDFLADEGFPKTSFVAHGQSAKYIQFIGEELKPFIEGTYRTEDRSVVIGESLAGLLATEVLLKKPELFTDYIIISPSLWWGGRALLSEANVLLNKNLKKEVNVYIGAPSKDEDTKMFNEVEQLHATVERYPQIRTVFDYLPEETHATVIHQAVYNALLFLKPLPTVSRP